MRKASIVAASILSLASCATAHARAVSDDPALRQLTVDRLEKFSSEQEFSNYLRRVQVMAQARGFGWSGEPVQYAQLAQPPCDPSVSDECAARERVVVTGSQIGTTSRPAMPAASATGTATITNLQKAGVDEGDIVKRIGKHLVVLQDGRLFSVDTSPGGGDGLILADRKNVYRSTTDDSWFDEILVSGRRVLVTGYSYQQDATQLVVLNMDEHGRFTEEGTFFLSSNDYYDTSNYATRLVGDRLVIYSPIFLADVDLKQPLKWPLIRRWQTEPGSSSGKQLFDAKDIYKPLQPTLSPAIHTVSVCDLGPAAITDNLACRSTAFVGPSDRTFFVSPDDVFVWVPTTDDLHTETCKMDDPSPTDRSVPAMVFKTPLTGGKPKVMMTRGMPRDQFAMDASTGEFRALVYWGRSNCDAAAYDDEGRIELRYFSAPMSKFRDDTRSLSAPRFTPTPSPGHGDYETRFTDRYVVYGGRDSWSDYPPFPEDGPQSARLVAVPVDAPDAPVVLTSPHGISRLERIGNDIVATGYHDGKGLSISLVDLDSAPRLADTFQLEGRYESERRSHAFNARLDAQGGLLGLPTVVRREHAGRWWWWSDVSDVNFLTFDKAGRLSQVGALPGTEKSEHPDYACEVSCIDWYGNARPIFIDDRIYALTGTELVEGKLTEGQMIEVRRLNLTAPVSPSQP